MSVLSGAAGSAFGPGCVYVMMYKSNDMNYYKIGCTSRDPNRRLREIRRSEGNDGIQLVGYVRAKEMNGAETAAQTAVKALGLIKDPERGGATDWFKGLLPPNVVMDAVRKAVQEHNKEHK